jgi:hypothetical protein
MWTTLPMQMIAHSPLHSDIGKKSQSLVLIYMMHYYFSGTHGMQSCLSRECLMSRDRHAREVKIPALCGSVAVCSSLALSRK